MKRYDVLHASYIKKEPEVAPSGSCAYALLLLFSVKPLANVVCDYTCSNR